MSGAGLSRRTPIRNGAREIRSPARLSRKWPTTVQPGLLLGVAPQVARANLPPRQLRLERVAMEPAQASRLADVAANPGEHAQHHLLLEPIAGLIQRQRVLRQSAGDAERELQGQVIDTYRGTIGQNHRALDDVLQLPDV